ncbi:MAG: hypothetical protein Q9183_006835, partial [Haloplaca sp. 2 TL-2023]
MPVQRSSQPGIALSPMMCNDFIEYVIHHHLQPTTIVVCSSREAFLENLQSSLQAIGPQQDSTTGERNEDNASLHPLLIPTIHQLSTSRTITLAFAPSLPHLRAYLASYVSMSVSKAMSVLPRAKPGVQVPMLAVYGLVNLHRTTTEYSVQGLSRSFAIAVEAADSWGLRLILTENLRDQTSSTADQDLEAEAAPTGDPWAEQ